MRFCTSGVFLRLMGAARGVNFAVLALSGFDGWRLCALKWIGGGTYAGNRFDGC